MLPLAYVVAGTQVAAGDAPSPVGVAVGIVLVALLWIAGTARRRRVRRACARFGHVADPTTLGFRVERCARCGARLR